MIDAASIWIGRLARGVAILGGFVLVAIALMTAVSIFGRSMLQFGLKPISGDFEMVEAGTAFVVCAFLPWCQLQRGHASVGVFFDYLGLRPNLVADLIADVLLLAAALLLTWRHIAGLLDKYAYGELTFILQYPLWWAYAGCLLGLFAWIVVGAWTVAADIEAFRKGERRMGAGGAH